MAKPEEFTIHIEPDGRIILEAEGLREESYRRIIAFLEETVGPVQQLEVAGDPPTTHIHPATGARSGRKGPARVETRRGDPEP
ncbi:MAG: DUF2997 domain-containing protein [bacterium]|nr:DUF2997 domain-containing protein [bacterium]